MEVVGHRGAPAEALENSMESFHLAMDSGATRIELDIHLTKDEEIVVIHDEKGNRTTDSNLDIKQSTIETVSKIRLKNGEKIPLLSDIINELLPKIELNIEIKTGGIPIAQKLFKELPPVEKRLKKIIISSFDHKVLQFISEQFPQETIAILWDTSLDIEAISSKMKKMNCNIFHPDADLLDQNSMKMIRKFNWQVVPYISQAKESPKEDVWEHAWTLGVDGFCTNFPREMVTWKKGRV